MEVFAHIMVYRFIEIWGWVSHACVVVTTLLLTMALYEMPLQDHYKILVVVSFLLTFFIIREIESLWSQDADSFKDNKANLLVVWMIIIGILLLIGNLIKYSQTYSYLVLFTWFVITPLPLRLMQVALNRLKSVLFPSTSDARRVVFAGATEVSQTLIEQFSQNQNLARDFVGYFDDQNIEQIEPLKQGKVLGQMSELAEYVKHNHIDEIYISLPIRHAKQIQTHLDALQHTTASIYYVPDTSSLPSSKLCFVGRDHYHIYNDT